MSKMKIAGTKKQFIAWLIEFGTTWEDFLKSDWQQRGAFVDMFNSDVSNNKI